jgi:hypothetical protein
MITFLFLDRTVKKNFKRLIKILLNGKKKKKTNFNIFIKTKITKL